MLNEGYLATLLPVLCRTTVNLADLVIFHPVIMFEWQS